MSGIDLYGLRSRWPSIRRRSPAPAPAAVDRGRSTVLDSPLGQERARRADPRRVADLLSQLIVSIEGKPLSAFVPMAEAVPLLVGITPANVAAFDEFLAAFIGVVSELGRVVDPPSVTSPSDSVSANRRALAAASLGVRRAAAVQPGRSTTSRKFDDLVAHFSEGKTLAVVLGEADDGLPPGVSEIVHSMLVAIKNNLKNGSPEGAREAGADAGVLIAAVHAAFFGGETSERALRARGGRVVRDHTAGLDGPVLVRKAPRSARAGVKFLDVDGEQVPVEDVKAVGKKFVRRRLRKV